eukprot:3844095-Pleurochrysis_carterae.AAC.4
MGVHRRVHRRMDAPELAMRSKRACFKASARVRRRTRGRAHRREVALGLVFPVGGAKPGLRRRRPCRLHLVADRCGGIVGAGARARRRALHVLVAASGGRGGWVEFIQDQYGDAVDGARCGVDKCVRGLEEQVRVTSTCTRYTWVERQRSRVLVNKNDS